MFCPECKAEYRPGFTRCADCEVDLVYKLPGESTAASSDPGDPSAPTELFDPRPVWRGIVQEACLQCCYQLRDEQIPYRVTEALGPRGRRMSFGRRYVLYVSQPDYVRAKTILQLNEDPPETFTEADWQEWERPDHADQSGDPRDTSRDHSEREQSGEDELTCDPSVGLEARRDAFCNRWYPEDATVEVWSTEDFPRDADGIEMALKEHFIHCRVEKEGDAVTVFVMPHDESLARCIVQDMIDGGG